MYSNLAEVIIKLETLVFEQQQQINDLEQVALLARVEAESYKEAGLYYKKAYESIASKEDPKKKWDDFFKPSSN